jgi:hypothetical protein
MERSWHGGCYFLSIYLVPGSWVGTEKIGNEIGPILQVLMVWLSMGYCSRSAVQIRAGKSRGGDGCGNFQLTSKMLTWTEAPELLWETKYDIAVWWTESEGFRAWPLFFSTYPHTHPPQKA